MPQIWHGEAFDYPADPESGATRVRLTTSLLHHCNVYCEHGYSSPDGRRIAILRSFYADPRVPPFDLLVADLYTLRYTIVEKECASIMVATAGWSGILYYLNRNLELMRVDMTTLEKQVVWSQWPFSADFIIHTVSPDQRYLLGQLPQANFKNALVRIDLQARDWKIIYEDYEISNAHPVYNPIHGHDINVMKAGGFGVNDRQQVKELGTPRIVTHFHIDGDGKNVRPIPLGPPHSPNSTGHTGWIADTGRIACVVAWDYERYRPVREFPDGNIFWAGPQDKSPKCFKIPEHAFQHIGVSRCGKYFVAESYAAGIPGPVPLIVGCFETGKWRPLLSDCKAQGGASCVSHPHAYFTADNKHVVYNADPTMIGHVYAARVPEAFLASLD
jgi:hypothetical protein